MKIIYLLTAVVFTAGLPLKAQTIASANSTDSIEHIEMYGETGKGDTAIIFYKNGDSRKVQLANEKERYTFLKKYRHSLPIHPVYFTTPGRHAENEDQLNSEIIVPKEIMEYTYNDNTIQLKLRNGKEELYNLKDPTQKRKFIDKYNNFLKLEKK